MNHKQVLILPRYTAKGPSSRIRMVQYLPYLETASFDVDIHPFFKDAYVDSLFQQKSRTSSSVLKSYFRRMCIALKSKHYDLVWMQYELLPWLPYWLEKLFLHTNVKLIIDYDDAIFHRYDLHKSSFVRAILGQKIDRWMHQADLVTAGNDYLAQRAKSAGAQHVIILPSVVDLEKYPLKSKPEEKSKPLCIGWIGSPTTVHYLLKIGDVIKEMTDQGTRFVIIGAEPPEQLAKCGIESYVWTLDNEARLINDLDIGVMPLPNQPFERGKCGYKLIQYMACSLPVVASPVGVNRKIVQDGKNGFLVESKNEWLAALERLAQSPALCQKLGRNGRKLVESEYSLQTAAPILVEYFSQLI